MADLINSIKEALTPKIIGLGVGALVVTIFWWTRARKGRSLPSLSSERNTTLRRFQNATNENNVQFALQLLERNQWNLMNSLREYKASGRSQRNFVQNMLFFISSMFGFSGKARMDPETASIVFLQEFEEAYGTQHPPFALSYKQGTQEAKSNFKFLIAYLHSPGHSRVDDFCRNIFCSEIISSFISENFICWAGDTQTGEGARLSRMLHVSDFPFFAIIACNGPQPVLVGRIEGSVTLESLLQQLTLIMETRGNELSAAFAESQQIEMDRQLREEQDLAFQQSLIEDQEKERKKREAEEEVKKIESDLEARRLHREQMKKQLPSEPQQSDQITTLLVRLPEGGSLQRRFLKEDPIQKVLDFVESELPPEIEEFELVTHFPLVEYSERPTVTLGDAGLCPRASLFVQLKDNDESA